MLPATSSCSTSGAELQSGPENVCHYPVWSKILSVECVDLMDSSGKVMNLEASQHSVALASSVLVQRQFYVLLRVCRDDAGGRTYVSLLNNYSQSHPELTGNKNQQKQKTAQQD
uniref:CST complex subunit CTC1 n=2 Tax=Amphiprion TaxID=80969 RepID=A0AAQ5X8C9_AMPOC